MRSTYTITSTYTRTYTKLTYGTIRENTVLCRLCRLFGGGGWLVDRGDCSSSGSTDCLGNGTPPGLPTHLHNLIKYSMISCGYGGVGCCVCSCRSERNFINRAYFGSSLRLNTHKNRGVSKTKKGLSAHGTGENLICSLRQYG